MTHRDREFREKFERELPQYVKMCQGQEPTTIFHQDTFAANYQPAEFTLLGITWNGDKVRGPNRKGDPYYRQEQ